VRRGDIEKRLDHYYHKPEFEIEAKRIETSPHPKTELGELCPQITDGTHFTPSYVEAGIPFISVKDVREFEISFEDTKFVSEEEHKVLASRCNPQPGDILLTKVGTVGLAAVIPPDAPVFDLFVSVCLLKIDKRRALPEFLCAVFNTHIARTQFARHLKGIGVPDLHLENIRECQIPLPPLETQRELVAHLDAARQERAKRLADADALLTGLDDFLLDELKLQPPSSNIQLTYAVLAKDLRGKRLDAPAYQPLYKKGQNPNISTRRLKDIANINVNTSAAPSDETSLVPYVGLPECNIDSVREIAQRPFSEVRGRSIMRPGDILFARIEPSIFNKKYVLVEELQGYDVAYTSTEFYVVRAKPGTLQSYLYAAFFCSFVFGQVRGKTTGSSGRRRLDLDTFADLEIPFPPLGTQERIAAEVQSRRERVCALRAEAERDWDTAKARFEAALLS
jgi:restriction endonuclease S subunit